MQEKLSGMTSRNKGLLAAAAVVLVLAVCFGYLAFGGRKPAPDYTGLWETHDKTWVYIEKGEKAVDYTGAVTGLIDKTETTYFVNKGDVDLSYTGLGASEGGWVYFTKGVLDDTFTGFAEGDDVWYWVKDGAVDPTYTGAREGTIDGVTTWWCVKDGVADFAQNGPVSTKQGILYFKDGK
ncbi:MAG: hypothetical protein J5847_04105, partial [Clostridia bacterium]|nr:hypothetical protein [Clostridia bacterium]